MNRFALWLLGTPVMLALMLLGWRIDGTLPEEKKFVAIGVPHTSGTDIFLLLYATAYLRIRPFTLAKAELMHGISGMILRWLGAISVDRTQSQHAVDSVVQAFQAQDNMVLVLSPEGTRHKTDRWRSGFYHIALKAEVPILMIAVNYPLKRLTLSEPLVLTGNIETDMNIVRAFFVPSRTCGRNPERFGEIWLAAEKPTGDIQPENP